MTTEDREKLIEAGVDALTRRPGYGAPCHCPDDWREDTPERQARCPQHGDDGGGWKARYRGQAAVVVDAVLAALSPATDPVRAAAERACKAEFTSERFEAMNALRAALEGGESQ